LLIFSHFYTLREIKKHQYIDSKNYSVLNNNARSKSGVLIEPLQR
ncbi:MAG: hypothetical protein ACI9DO_003631, partial [Reinekea sp.]